MHSAEVCCCICGFTRGGFKQCGFNDRADEENRPDGVSMSGESVTEVDTPYTVMTRAGKIVLSCLIIGVIGYYYVREFSRYPINFHELSASFNPWYVLLALLFCLLSYLVDAVIWKSVISTQVGHDKIGIREIMAILYTSGLFRYVPGRVWIYATQFALFKKYGITRSRVIAINAVCMIDLMITSLYFGLIYLAMFPGGVSVSVVVLAAVLLLLLNMLYVCYNSVLMNRLLALAGRITNTKIQPIYISATVLVGTQALSILGWLLTGVAAYLLAVGIGLPIIPRDTVSVIASLSLSWMAGYLSVVTPAGLGVREGVMLLILKPVLAVQTALVLPIATRVLLLISEGFLGMLALYFGLRLKVFSPGDNSGKISMDE